MRMVKPTSEVPKRRNGCPKWLAFLSEFDRSDANMIEVVFDNGEYKNVRIAQSVACNAIRRHKFNMNTAREGNKLFLIKNIPGKLL